jgi:hypothetical protein
MDANNGGDTLSFDCAYGIVDVDRDGFQDFVVRCKQITDTDKGRAKIEDSTVLYSLAHGQFKRRRITDDSEALALTGKICKPNSSHWLCKLPGYMTATSERRSRPDVSSGSEDLSGHQVLPQFEPKHNNVGAGTTMRYSR